MRPDMELRCKMHGSARLALWVLSCLPWLRTLVRSQLVFSTQPQHAVGLLGAPLTLDCAVYDLGQQRALPVLWEKSSGMGTSALPHTGPESLAAFQLANGSLFLPLLRASDLGDYVCSSAAGADHINATVRVEKAGLGAVFFSPRNQTASEGEAVFLQCVSGDSSPAAHISWMKDGELVKRGKQIQGQYGGGHQRKTSGTLHLPGVTAADGGVYECVTHNALLNASRRGAAAVLAVLGAPGGLRITQGPASITVAMGTEAVMRCAVQGRPVPMVHWFKDDRLLTARSASPRRQDNGQLLVFRNVSEEDEGSYHCEAFSQQDVVRSPPALLLLAVMDWRFVLQPSSQTARRGDNVTLVCRPPRSQPPAGVSWVKDGQPLRPRAHLTTSPAGDLFLHSVREADAGTYVCRASNHQLNRTLSSRTAALTVLVPPAVSLRPRLVTLPPGGSVRLLCEVEGLPPPSIRWYKRGPSTQTGGRVTVGRSNASLHFLSVRDYDQGAYTCEATNTLGQDRRTATIRVTAMPVIVGFSGQVSSRPGAAVELPCRAVGLLPITYTWTRGNETAEQHASTTVTDTAGDTHARDGALQILAARRTDAGDYYCRAENQAGRDQIHTVLTITEDSRAKNTREQRRKILSASTNTNEELPAVQFNGTLLKNHSGMNHGPHPGIPALTFTSQRESLYVDLTTTGSPDYQPLLAKLDPQPTQPTQPHTQPTTQPAQPALPDTQPTTQPAQPDTHPTPQPAQPAQPDTHPTPQPAQPDTQPTPQPAQPAQPDTQPTPQPAQPAQPDTQPTPQPAQPAQPDTQPTPQPAQPAQPDTQPTTQPAQPDTQSAKLAQPAQPDTQPTTQPAQPAQPDTQPTTQPAQPAQPDTQPTTQPAQPDTQSAKLAQPDTQSSTIQPVQPDTQSTTQPAQPAQPTLNSQLLQPPPSPSDPQPSDPQDAGRIGPLPHISLPVSSPYSASHATRSPAPAPREPGLRATPPRRSFGPSHLTHKSTAGRLQHAGGQTSAKPSGVDRVVSHRHEDPPALPQGTGASLVSSPKSVLSLSRSSDSPTPFLTPRDNSVTPVDRRGPDAVALSLALPTTLRVSRQSFTPSPDSGPQLQQPPAQEHPAESQPAQDIRVRPEERTQVSQTHSSSTQSSFPQSARELPLTSIRDEPQPTPSPPSPESSFAPHGASPTGPLSSSTPEPQLSSTQLHGPFHAPPSVPSTTTPSKAPTTPSTSITTSMPTPSRTTTSPTTSTTTPSTITSITTSTPIPSRTTTTTSPTTSTTTPSTTTSITTSTPIPSRTTTTTSPTTSTTTSTTTLSTTTSNTTSTPTPSRTTTTTSPTTSTTTSTTTPSTTTSDTTSKTTTTTTPSTTPSSTTPTTSTRADHLTSPSRTSVPEGPSPGVPTGPDGVRSNVSQAVDPAPPSGSTTDPRPTVGLKTNTSQSPMTSDDLRVTQKSPSWLPGLEKHDIPIVVGVGVSLAFIFITMAFYSLFQNNEPVPINRAGLAQRNVGVPIRHTERQTPGKTYDNRAFEDDECVAVIEQSPNTSDTRARPLGSGLVMVQMGPPPEDLSENHQLSLMEDHTVPTETFPLGALVDSQVEAGGGEAGGSSLSPPSARLRCVEDWVSSGGSLPPVCQEPPPSSLTPPFSLPPPLSSHSPSPTVSLCPSSPSRSSLATVREERLHSSLSLQAPASPPCSSPLAPAASPLPVHHSLSVSHAASSPLLVSHRVSLGSSATVTVDVTFHPPSPAPAPAHAHAAAAAATAIATSTHISSRISSATPGAGPLFDFPLANGREGDQSASRTPHGK